MTEPLSVLDEDPVIKDQRLCLISISNVDNDPKKTAMKIRGVYKNKSQCDIAVKKLPDFGKIDIMSVEVGKWFPVIVDIKDTGEIRYDNDKLNEIVAAKRQRDQDAKDLFDKRKADLINDHMRRKNAKESQDSKKESYVSVFNRMYDLELKIKDLKKILQEKETELQEATELGNTYTTEERQQSVDEFILVEDPEELKYRYSTLDAIKFFERNSDVQKKY